MVLYKILYLKILAGVKYLNPKDDTANWTALFTLTVLEALNIFVVVKYLNLFNLINSSESKIAIINAIIIITLFVINYFIVFKKQYDQEVILKYLNLKSTTKIAIGYVIFTIGIIFIV